MLLRMQNIIKVFANLKTFLDPLSLTKSHLNMYMISKAALSQMLEWEIFKQNQ